MSESALQQQKAESYEVTCLWLSCWLLSLITSISVLRCMNSKCLQCFIQPSVSLTSQGTSSGFLCNS